MNVSDGEEAHVEGVDQVRDSDKSSEQTESVLRRLTRNRRLPDKYGNQLSIPDVESDDGISVCGPK